MISFLAVSVLSFMTLCLGTYMADRIERRCAAPIAAEHDRAPR